MSRFSALDPWLAGPAPSRDAPPRRDVGFVAPLGSPASPASADTAPLALARRRVDAAGSAPGAPATA